MRTIGRAGLVLVATMSLVAMLASSANARQFRMTGTWVQQRGPNAQIPIFGGIPNKEGAMVSAQGTGTATLTIPRGQFTGMNQLLLPLPIDSIVQLSTMFTFRRHRLYSQPPTANRAMAARHISQAWKSNKLVSMYLPMIGNVIFAPVALDISGHC